MGLQQFDLENYTDFKKSMYIEASAGTGKTYTITGIIQKLVDAKVELEKILVVTYTEKAAGELRDRIRKACPDKDVDNAPIFTIHSFCQKTLSDHIHTLRDLFPLHFTNHFATLLSVRIFLHTTGLSVF